MSQVECLRSKKSAEREGGDEVLTRLGLGYVRCDTEFLCFPRYLEFKQHK